MTLLIADPLFGHCLRKYNKSDKVRYFCNYSLSVFDTAVKSTRSSLYNLKCARNLSTLVHIRTLVILQQNSCVSALKLLPCGRQMDYGHKIQRLPRHQGNLKGESVVAAILPSCMEVSYCTCQIILLSVSCLSHMDSNHTHILDYCAVNHVVTIVCADHAE